MGSSHKDRMVLSILKCSLSAEGAALLLLASLGTGLLFKQEQHYCENIKADKSGIGLSFYQYGHENKTYFDFSFLAFPQLLCSRSCASLVLRHSRDVKLLFPVTEAVISHQNMDYSKAFGAQKEGTLIQETFRLYLQCF